MEQENKSCKNCKYGVQHYSIFHGRFSKLPNAMHCSNGKITRKSFEKFFRENISCEHYEPYELKVQENKQSIKRLLIQISSQLDNAIKVLENYKDDD